MEVSWFNYNDNRLLKVRNKEKGFECYAFYDNLCVFWDLIDFDFTLCGMTNMDRIIKDNYILIEDLGYIGFDSDFMKSRDRCEMVNVGYFENNIVINVNIDNK